MAYGPNFLVGGTASAESEDVPDGLTADKAFDGNTETRWATVLFTLPEWLQYDLGVGVTKTATKYRMWGKETLTFMPTGWDFQGSNNGSSWTNLDTRTSQTFTDQAWNEYTFSNSTAYRYYRVSVNTSGSAAVLQIWEVQAFETVAGVLPSSFMTTNTKFWGG